MINYVIFSNYSYLEISRTFFLVFSAWLVLKFLPNQSTNIASLNLYYLLKHHQHQFVFKCKHITFINCAPFLGEFCEMMALLMAGIVYLWLLSLLCIRGFKHVILHTIWSQRNICSPTDSVITSISSWIRQVIKFHIFLPFWMLVMCMLAMLCYICICNSFAQQFSFILRFRVL